MKFTEAPWDKDLLGRLYPHRTLWRYTNAVLLLLLLYEGSLLWNSLSDELKDTVGTGTFINKLKELLINK